MQESAIPKPEEREYLFTILSAVNESDSMLVFPILAAAVGV
jgi:hypothetical protein